MTEGTKRQQQAAQTKDRITQCAIRLIMERGYDAITISDICREAGVSNGNFYHYFTSKDDVLLFNYSGFDEFVEREFSKLHFDSPKEAILALIDEQVVGVNEVGPKYQAQCMQAQLKHQGGFVIERDRYFHRYLQKLVEQAVQVGEIHPSYGAEEVARMILQTSRGILFDWSIRGGPYPAEKQAMETLQILFVALRQPKPPEKPYETRLLDDQKSMDRKKAPGAQPSGRFAMLPDKHLCPVISLGDVAHPDLGKAGVQDVFPVPLGVHPAVDHRLGGGVAVGDVLPRSPVGEAEGPYHLEGASVGGAGVGEVEVVRHILGLIAGHPAQLPIQAQLPKAALPADGIHQPDHLRLKREHPLVKLRDIQTFTGVDEIGICHLGVGGDDLAGAYLVADRQLPHGVTGDHRMGQGVGAGGEEGAAQHSGAEKGQDPFLECHRNHLII